MKKILAILGVAFSIYSFSQEYDTIPVQSMPEGFCMPKGFWVVNVYNADIDNNGTLDRIIKYYKKDWQCADSVFFDAFKGIGDSTYIYYKTFANLCTPMVRDFVDLDWLTSNCSDGYISQYAWDNQMWVKFQKGIIKIPFATDLWTGYDFYFEYDKNRDNFYLTKKQEWYIPDGEYEIKYSTESEIELVKDGICIDDFKIKNYLKPW